MVAVLLVEGLEGGRALCLDNSKYPLCLKSLSFVKMLKRQPQRMLRQLQTHKCILLFSGIGMTKLTRRRFKTMNEHSIVDACSIQGVIRTQKRTDAKLSSHDQSHHCPQPQLLSRDCCLSKARRCEKTRLVLRLSPRSGINIRLSLFPNLSSFSLMNLTNNTLFIKFPFKNLLSWVDKETVTPS